MMINGHGEFGLCCWYVKLVTPCGMLLFFSPPPQWTGFRAFPLEINELVSDFVTRKIEPYNSPSNNERVPELRSSRFQAVCVCLILTPLLGLLSPLWSILIPLLRAIGILWEFAQEKLPFVWFLSSFPRCTLASVDHLTRKRWICTREPVLRSSLDSYSHYAHTEQI